MGKPIAPWFALAFVIVVLDQLTKSWASTALLYAVPREIWPGFNLTLLHNTGAAFSLFSDQPGWQRWFFTAIASVISVIVMVWMWRLRRDQYTALAALGLILGGAAGNLFDRINHGYVIDFIQLYYRDWYWPAFNIADSAITVGAVILIIKGPGELAAKASPAELDQT